MQQLAEEIRREIVEKVSVKGGHLAPNLGVVELTMALHYVFDTPKDLLVWDIGHQAYVHKLLTGRRDRFHTIRQLAAFLATCAARKALTTCLEPAMPVRPFRQRSAWQWGVTCRESISKSSRLLVMAPCQAVWPWKLSITQVV